MLNIRPLESEEIKTKEVEKISQIGKDRHGNLIFKDPLFESMKKVINEDINSIRNSIRFSQYGTKIVFYQGNPSNFWGFVELAKENSTDNEIKREYTIRIYSSILKKIFKKNDLTKEFFEGVI